VTLGTHPVCVGFTIVPGKHSWHKYLPEPVQVPAGHFAHTLGLPLCQWGQFSALGFSISDPGSHG
jgi:hypothetical protein